MFKWLSAMSIYHLQSLLKWAICRVITYNANYTNDDAQQKLHTQTKYWYKEVPIVLLANAVIEPNTMMIKSLYTSITLGTVLTAFITMSLTYITKHILWFVSEVKRTLFIALPLNFPLKQNYWVGRIDLCSLKRTKSKDHSDHKVQNEEGYLDWSP